MRRPVWLPVWLLALCGLAACAGKPYADDRAGRFAGRLQVVWVSQGNQDAGDGNFLYVPSGGRPLVFKRPAGVDGPAEIQPGLLFTDGGSIPKLLQIFGPLSPWGYGPAYVIHDWLFVVHHCFVDGTPRPGTVDLSFPQSVDILGEAIRTLQTDHYAKVDEGAGVAVVAAVGAPITRAKWDRRGACPPPPTQEQVRAVLRVLPGITPEQARALMRLAEPKAGPAVKGLAPAPAVARLVATVDY